MNKWKKILIIIIAMICIGIIIKFLIKNDYKSYESGNNKNIEEIEDYILNINSYQAQIKVTVQSNKNTNEYTMTQEVKKEYCKQTVNEPKNIAGMEITYQNGQISINNTELGLNKIYENYPLIEENYLFLTDFTNQYSICENRKIMENESRIIMEYNSNKNKYNFKQKLYIDKESLKPIKIEILDKNNDTKVYILYNEIELNI